MSRGTRWYTVLPSFNVRVTMQGAHVTHAEDGRYRSYEEMYRSYLDTDARPAIRAASADQLRLVLRRIAANLCYRLRLDLTESLPPGPAPTLSWGVCQTDSATRAGCQLYHQVGQVIAASCLHTLGFDPHTAAADDAYLTTSVEPVLTTASRRRMRGLLLNLDGHIQAIMADADASAGWIPSIELLDNAWEAGTGVATAIQLYRHATLIQTAYVLYHLWDGLSTSGTPTLAPFTPDTTRAAFLAPASPN
jgi:hypothetical protein